ncbi:chromosomal replication initiator protein DnaA [soil metagenome]
MGEAHLLWTACSEVIRSQVTEAVWLTTFHSASPVAVESDRLVLAVPSTLVKERVEGRYRSLVLDSLAELGYLGFDLEVQVHTRPVEDDPLAVTADEAESTSSSRPAETVGRRPDDTGHPPSDRVNSRYTFDAFVTGSSNRFAHAAALAVAEQPARSYNPLFIYGDAGLGKTHLLHAIGHYVLENYPAYTVRYVSSETFLNDFIRSIQTGAIEAFKRRYRNVDVLLVDDIQFVAGKDGFREEFFHTFNALREANRQIVLSSDRTPDAIPTLEDLLRSRFKQGLITDILPPDLETRIAILRKKAERETTGIPDSVLEFIATNITENIRELEGALIRVSAFASLTNEHLTSELAERVLSDILTDRQPRVITPDIIIDATSAMFGFAVEEIKGKNRRRPLVTARQVAMYVHRELTDLSFPAIGREFGGRDHTTVMHAVDKIRNLMKERRQIYDQVTELIQVIKKG